MKSLAEKAKPLNEIMNEPDVIRNQGKVVEAMMRGESTFEAMGNFIRSMNEAMMPSLKIERQKKEN